MERWLDDEKLSLTETDVPGMYGSSVHFMLIPYYFKSPVLGKSLTLMFSRFIILYSKLQFTRYRPFMAVSLIMIVIQT